jgi:putative transposase
MKYPAELNDTPSTPYKGLRDLPYPSPNRTITVTHCGRICIGRRNINLRTDYAGQNVGIKEASDKVCWPSFIAAGSGFH